MNKRHDFKKSSWPQSFYVFIVTQYNNINEKK